jgi:hypothetical protein
MVDDINTNKMNWKIVFIIYKDNGIFIFDESQFTAAIDDLTINIKKTIENIDIKTMIGKQSHLMLHFLNNCGEEKCEEMTADLELWNTEQQKDFSISVVLMSNEQCLDRKKIEN